jgi:hypothetical protein
LFDIAPDHAINGCLVRSDFVSLHLSIPHKPLVAFFLIFQLSVPLHLRASGQWNVSQPQ